jgi:hypothetical protein
VLSGELRDDRWKQHEVDKRWIELRSTTFTDDANRIVDAAAFSIAPAVRDGVEGVGDRHDARCERNSATA